MRPDVLLLQGPIGPFFGRFAEELEQRGFTVWKVNFNGGDGLYYRRKRTIPFGGRLEEWEAFLERLIVNKSIGRIYLYGDCRAYHRIARKVALRHDLAVYVFEEGYIRPNFVTLEAGGVNGHSPMVSHRPDLDVSADAEEDPPELGVHNITFLRTAGLSVMYYLAARARRSRYPHYQHHRSMKVLGEGLRWLRSGVRKWIYQLRERDFFDTLLPQFENNYFVVPLQVHCDMQVVVHSRFNSIEHFIGEVMSSFARHADSNKALVFKHHPLDRAYSDYTLLIENMAAELGLSGRVFYVHDVCLPTLLRHAEGTVLINSTVGVSSLFHGTPVKTLGTAVYDLPGLTASVSLREFWRSAGSVDKARFEAFRRYLVQRNQLNGSFYRELDSSAGPTGLHWSERLKQLHSYDPDRFEPPTHVPRLRLVPGKAARSMPESGRDSDSASRAA